MKLLRKETPDHSSSTKEGLRRHWVFRTPHPRPQDVQREPQRNGLVLNHRGSRGEGSQQPPSHSIPQSPWKKGGAKHRHLTCLQKTVAQRGQGPGHRRRDMKVWKPGSEAPASFSYLQCDNNKEGLEQVLERLTGKAVIGERG